MLSLLLYSYALSPFIVFVHRFNFVVNLGSDTKTIQLFYPLIPLFLLGMLWQYHKKYGIRKIFTESWFRWLVALFTVDLVSVLISEFKTVALVALIVRVTCYSTFVTSKIWWKLVKHSGSVKLVRVFVFSLGGFAFINSLVSIYQLLDCSIFNKVCVFWAKSDAVFSKTLLRVGHQKFFGNIIRTPGFFGDVNLNGMFLAFILFIFSILIITYLMFSIYRKERITMLKWFYLVFFALFLLTLFLVFLLTNSRSATLGLIPVTTVFVSIFLYKLVSELGFKRQFWGGSALFLLTGVLVIIILFSSNSPAIINLRTKLTGQDKSANGHRILLLEALKLAKKSNYIGTGVGTYKVAYAKYINPNIKTRDPHSTYATLLVEEGALGLILYLGFFIYLWRTAIKNAIRYRERILNILKSRRESNNIEEALKYTLFAELRLAIPYFTIATVTYYGLFLPMLWFMV